jgi:predicted nuclease of restriction endonuclease-like (RecB) superfamily
MDIIKNEDQLILDIRGLIDQSKSNIARTINSQMTMLYWHIGKRIREEVMQEGRAEYGKHVLKNLANILSAEYGKGFTHSNLVRITQFYDSFPSIEISATLSQQLTWSHIIELLPLKSKEEQEFYAYTAMQNSWSVRDMRHNIHRMTFERTLVNQKGKLPEPIVFTRDERNVVLAPEMILRDPYILDFLQLEDVRYENDLETAILKEIEKFILELGTGFSFVARQKRMTIDNDHFYLDLLFYNRKLKRMVAVELKTGKFKPEYKGQMELYLGYLTEYETYEDELPPIGIILCTSKSSRQIELLNMGTTGIHVAEYWTELPPKDVFERKIQEIVLSSTETLVKLKGKK